MAPINSPANRSFRLSHESKRSRDRNMLFGNESVTERVWDIDDNMEEDVKDASVILSDDMSDVSPPPSPDHASFDLLGPEIESFAQSLDAARSLVISDSGYEEAVQASYKLMQQYHYTAFNRLQEHKIAWEGVNIDRTKVGEDGCEYAFNDQTKRWINSSMLEANTRYWELETETWDLLLILCQHRFGKDRNSRASALPDEINHPYSSNLKFKDFLLRSNPHFKELNLILDWVKRKAPTPEQLQDTRGAGWAYTKESLKSRKRLRCTGSKSYGSYNLNSPPRRMSEEDLVTELDPDAPARQDKCLEEEDVAFERNLMENVWRFLRAGDIRGAMSICKQANDLWRAQSLAGIIDAWDEEIDGQRQGVHGLEGNRRRELSRRMCYRLAKESSAEEAAVYGVLSGDLESVLPMCTTWDDFLFAHLNSLVECHYSEFLSSQQRIPAMVEKFPIYNAIQDYGAADERVFAKIIDSLYNNKDIEFEAHESLHIIQGALISNRLSVIVAELSRQLENFQIDSVYEPRADSAYQGLDITDFRMLRVVVHILLILNNLGTGFSPETAAGRDAENVIAGYIDLLAEAGKHDLIPLYAGQLSREKATNVMGEILMKVIDEDTRLRLLMLMKNYGIDAAESLKRMMSNVFKITEGHYQVPMPKHTGILGSTTTGIRDVKAVSKEDETVVRALEWMLLVDELKSEILSSGCIAYKRFLMTGKLSSARELAHRLPSTAIVPSAHQVGLEGEEITANLAQSDKAIEGVMYIDFGTLMEAIGALEDWKVLAQKASESKRDRALHKTDLETALDAVQRQALPVGKAWLNHFLHPTEVKLPQKEIDDIVTIRNAYIPDIILALHQVYLDAGRLLQRSLLTETLELAAVVGSNTREGEIMVQCLMDTGRMREYVDKVAEASIQVLGAAQAGVREVTRRGLGPGGGAALSIWNVK